MMLPHRTDWGIMADETPVVTNKDNEGNSCKLLLPTPVLQFEIPHSKRPAVFYFGVEMILSEDDHYILCHGDQHGSIVFIAAIHGDGLSLPSAFLCLDADDYIKWLFPSNGMEPIVPMAEAWTLCNAIEFCKNNIKHDSDDCEVKVHLPTADLFQTKVLILIEELVEAKASSAYDFIFKMIFAENLHILTHGPQDHEGDDEPPINPRDDTKKKKKKNEKGKPKEKERYQLPRGNFLAPKVDVPALIARVQKEKSVVVNTKSKTAVVRKTVGNRKVAGKSQRKRKPSNKEADLEDTEDQELSDVEQEKNARKKSRGGGKSTQTQGVTDFQPLLSAISNSTGAIISSHAALVKSNTTPAPKQFNVHPPTRAELRDDSEKDHDLYQKKRMDDLKFLKEMSSIFSPAGQQHYTSMNSTNSTTTATASLMSPLNENIHADGDLLIAWRLLSSDESWNTNAEKEEVLTQQLGLTAHEDLKYLRADDMKMILGKLKVVPARRLSSILKLKN
jgi:hypothetical protein